MFTRKEQQDLKRKPTEPSDRSRIARRDWILALVILAAAGFLFLFLRMQQKPDGTMVEIRIDGTLYQSWPLSEDRTETIQTEYGTNVIQIRDGTVTVLEADCPGQDCIRQGTISRRNESLVCLPHRLVAEITRSDAEADGAPSDRVKNTEDGEESGGNATDEFDIVAK